MSKSKGSKKTKGVSDAELVASMDYAGTAIFLLSDYGRFGLAERVCYHFDLIEALAPADAKSSSSPDQEVPNPIISGVTGLLECTPLNPWHRLLQRQRRALKNQIRAFNAEASEVREKQSTSCYQPNKLPLALHPSSRLFFGYEVTRIAFCVDASPSLTSTFGVTGDSTEHCCPLDRLPEMARTFFKSLVEDVTSLVSIPATWHPELAVTVIAVYPLGKTVETSLLVRDYRVNDVESAEILAKKIDHWIHHEVEVGISERMCREHGASTWCIPLDSSSMQDILETGDYANSILSSEARPIIVVATDCRSVSCAGIVDVYLDIDRVDIPVFILDLSTPETHAMMEQPEQTQRRKNELNFLTYDPPNPSAFPLHLSDDSEALFGICRATGGCYLDSNLLMEASKTVAGGQPTTENIFQNSFKRRFVKMNHMQWLVLFSLSPLSPTFHSSWGKLAPPQYLQKHLKLSTVDDSIVAEGQSTPSDFSRHGGFARETSKQRNIDLRRAMSDLSAPTQKKSNADSRITFSTYVVSPIRIKALLLVRIKEGYRTVKYGSSTHDADKVFIQFTLPLQLGTVLHYELSYTALSSMNHMVGSAHVKIELSGNSSFIQSVKNDFLQQVQDIRPFTMAQKVSARLCQMLRWIRVEDLKCSYLCPPNRWSDQFGARDAPFVRRLGSLTPLQRRRHFQFDEFDIVFTGRMPYSINDDFLSEFLAVDNGEQELIDHLVDWSTQVVVPKSRYVKQMSTASGMTSYCVIIVKPSTIASRICSIAVEFVGGTDPSDRLEVLVSLKASINCLKDVEVLSKQLGPYLVGVSNTSFWNKGKIEIQYHHARWDLIKDPELLPLLMKRRLEIGRFRLLDSNPNSALFAKLVENDIARSLGGDIVQYQIAVLADKVVIDLHMESEGGVFSPFKSARNTANRFNAMLQTLRRRDQECARALRSRTNLLKVLQVDERDTGENVEMIEEKHSSSAQRILAYSSVVSRKLRFFNLPKDSAANDLLCQMTEDLLLSQQFGVKAAKLAIASDEQIKEAEPGLWFVVQFDRDTMSVVHLSLVDKPEETHLGRQTYRNLTYFTSSISDLYSKRDDMTDDDSTDSHISEYFCVTEFADHLEEAVKQNFSAAAYLAMRSSKTTANGDFDHADIQEVLRSCEFVEVTSVPVARESNSPDDSDFMADEQSKLYKLITTILRPVPGSDECMFYGGSGRLEDLQGTNGSDDDSSLSADDSMEMSLDSSSILAEEEGLEEVRNSDDLDFANDLEEDIDKSTPFQKSVSPPIFIRFKLDGEIASLRDLSSISQDTNLTAQISVFKGENATIAEEGIRELPLSHRVAAIEITALLKSFHAEQTIEGLRSHGTSVSEESLQLVTKHLKRVRTVVTFSFEVYFYVSKTDLMTSASAPAGSEAQVEEGFRLLNTELQSEIYFAFKPLSTGGFVVFPAEGTSEELDFWCFVYVDKNAGIIISQMYHPEGKGRATEVLTPVFYVLRSCLHRVNQKLLLKRLHASRTASSLLIPNPDDDTDVSESSGFANVSETFKPGTFSCPVVFSCEFDLYDRCGTMPAQAARNLEGTVLHSFAVSNRRSIFEYIDESGDIFYMRLKAVGGILDADGKVQLLVHGVNAPGPSVTHQLKFLLERRLLLIAVDALSSVLTKNPHFNWKLTDFEFLGSFEKNWARLETGEHKASKPEYFYEFPDEATDPCMILLMFRQNICGSTYFHRLNDIGHGGLSPAITLSRKLDSGGVALKWNEHAFTLYYNNAPSKLDPAFQGVSTLTRKGEILCREAGQGIAMLELSLIKSNGDSVDDCIFGEPSPATSTIGKVQNRSLQFRKLDQFPVGGETNSVCVRVRISGTTIKSDYLQQLVELTLNQALIGWYAERCLERISLKALQSPKSEKVIAVSPTASTLQSDLNRNAAINQIRPGLSGLMSILEFSHEMPHPAVAKIENHGVIRSSSVGTATLDLLEKSIFPSMFDTGKPEVMDMAKSNLSVIRLSRSAKVEVVDLSWDSQQQNALVTAGPSIARTEIKDSPIDCPEYLCFFSGGNKAIDPNLKVYEKVVVHDGISERSPSIELLESVKQENPSAFFRSLAFILSVKRDQRVLWAYNLNPQIAKSVSSSLKEANQGCLHEAGRSVGLLQSRCLKILAPSGGFQGVETEKPKSPSRHKKHSAQSLPSPSVNQPPARSSKIRRPVSIRRPKLIGKSVEGAAMQAVAASRKRASSKQFRNSAMSSPAKRSQNQRLVRQTSKVNAPKLPVAEAKDVRPALNHKEHEENDENLSRVKNDFLALCFGKNRQILRRSSLQSTALLKLATLWWPQKKLYCMPRAVGQFLMRQAPMAWSDTRPFPPLPSSTNELFLVSFARFIATFIPSLKILPLSSNQSGPRRVDSVILSSDIKNVRGCKVFTAVQISKASSRRGEELMRCKGVVLNLPRRSKVDQRMKAGANIKSILGSEKDSTGMDKLASDLHVSLVLDSLLFDFSASMVERAVRLFYEKGDTNNLVPTLRALISRYPLERQKRMPKLNYRVFEATVILKNYQDRFIRMFDSEELFSRLYTEAEDLDMIRCGDGLCYKKGISVKGSHSVCFLTPHSTDLSKMQLVILCRTQGRSLSDYMFRENSNVAIRILDNIALEASSLAFNKLRICAKKLLKDSLWRVLSSKTTESQRTHIQDNILEMLTLTHLRPLQHFLIGGNNGTRSGSFTLLESETRIDWARCCLAMEQEPCFQPKLLLEGGLITTHLFFLEPEDVFLLIGVDDKGALLKAGVVEKDEFVPLERRQMAIQKLSNFLLHFLWHNL